MGSLEHQNDLPRQLNLGAGLCPRQDCWNVDLRGEPDLRWDLDDYPYPLPRNHFEVVYANDVVEHLSSVQRFVEEVHGLLRPGGILEMTTPHFSSANSYTDPTHRQHLGYFSFDYFTEGHQWSFYSPVRFEIVKRQIIFGGGYLNRIVAELANRWPKLYENRWAWIFPSWFLIFQLRAIKPAA